MRWATFDQRDSLAQAVTAAPAIQSHVAVRAMRDGLTSVVPPLVLSILGASELEAAVVSGRL